jgi:hypothetical protein
MAKLILWLLAMFKVINVYLSCFVGWLNVWTWMQMGKIKSVWISKAHTCQLAKGWQVVIIARSTTQATAKHN